MAKFNPISFERFAPAFAKPEAAWRVMLLAGVVLAAVSGLGVWSKFQRPAVDSPRVEPPREVFASIQREPLHISRSQD